MSTLPSLLTDQQDPTEFVEACFRTFLKREADQAGRDYHLARMQQGVSRVQVIDSFVTSREYRDRERANQWVPAGHFYSPLPSIEEVAEFRDNPRPASELLGIDFQDEAQQQLMDIFAGLYATIPFADEATPGLRYRYNNSSYPAGDSIPLHCMIRHLKPRRFIEVGCGNSSCVTLDTNDLFFESKIDLTFIEPYPAFFHSLIRPEEQGRVRLLAQRLQDVPFTEFERLEARDILFIDSTHISKLNSDVNHFLFEIFPRLKPGVFVHIHDVFFPFEYPIKWLEEGRAWNEQYVLRSFLQYNDSFQIRYFNTYLFGKHKDWFQQHMPRCLTHPGGSIWLEKVR